MFCIIGGGRKLALLHCAPPNSLVISKYPAKLYLTIKEVNSLLSLPLILESAYILAAKYRFRKNKRIQIFKLKWKYDYFFIILLLAV